VIPALPRIPLHCICGHLSGAGLSSSQLGLSASRALDVAPTAAQLTPASRACARELLNSVPLSHHLDTILDYILCRLAPSTTNTIHDAAICLFCLIFLMVWGFASHRTWVGIPIPWFSTSHSSGIFCRLSVPCPIYHMSRTAWIFSLSQDSSSSTSMTPWTTVRAMVMMTSQDNSAVATIAFWWVTAGIVPLAVLFAFIIRMRAGALCWRSALLIADAISWSILLGGGTLLSLLDIRHLSAMLDSAVGEGYGPGAICAL